jgi:hypothetical protein
MEDPPYRMRFLEILCDGEPVRQAEMSPEEVKPLGAIIARSGSVIPWSQMLSGLDLLSWWDRHRVAAGRPKAV